MSILRLTSANSLVVVIDLQERLLIRMPDMAGLLRDVGFLLDVANLLQLPIMTSEQYPQGLGPTHPEILRRVPKILAGKVAFSCCGGDGFMEQLAGFDRSNLVLAGMETHVCVLNTALDLLEKGFNIMLPVDGVSARFCVDHDIALRRLERAGCVLTTVETIAFEWVGGANHPQFKPLSKLVQHRMGELMKSQSSY